MATRLVVRGAEVEFICRAHDGNLINMIQQRGFRVVRLPPPSAEYKPPPNGTAHAHWLGCDWQKDAKQCIDALIRTVDWLIVDHYELDQHWETAMRGKCAHIMCIDDLADRQHDCDILLDQNLGRRAEHYVNLVAAKTKLLIGPNYALLRPEFVQSRQASLARRNTPQLRHLLIAMGGVDANNATGAVLAALMQCEVLTLEKITAVLGPHALWRDQLLIQAAEMPVPTQVLFGVDNMAERMTSCDLAIGAGGSTTWERCALGVPSVLIVLAENQRNIADYMKRTGAAFVIDANQRIGSAVRDAMETCQKLNKLWDFVQACATVCDGAGGGRVIAELDR